MTRLRRLTLTICAFHLGFSLVATSFPGGNRVLHHEPVRRPNGLPEQHHQILETIGWISPALLAVTRLLDQFSSVYTRGAQHYALELESVAQNWSA